MLPELPQGLLLAFSVLVGMLACAAPLHWLLVLDLLLVTYPGQWLISEVHVDFTDIIVAGIIAGMLLRPQERRHALQWRTPHTSYSLLAAIVVPLVAMALMLLMGGPAGGGLDVTNLLLLALGAELVIEMLRWRIPYLGLWVATAVLFSLAYVHAEVNAEFFAGPTSIAYQVYRYCWRLLLYYPFVVLLVRDRKQMETLLLAIVVSGTACALMAFRQGFVGDEATGPFVTKNVLGGALCMPFLLAVGLALGGESAWARRACGLCALLMARGLLFAGSRGAYVAVFLGTALLLTWLMRLPAVRGRTVRFAVIGLFLAATAFTLQPSLLDRPNIQHLFTTSRGAQDENMRWRIEQRWPHFWGRILQHPWLGVGTDIDTTLGDSAVTPHNGYLGLAIVSGLPATVSFVLLAFLGVGNGMRAFHKGRRRWQKIAAIAMATAIVAFLLHNMIDQTFKLPYAQKVLWIFIAFTTALLLRRAQFDAELLKPRPRPQAPGMALVPPVETRP